jgi:deazaflavin-dependent oxidoreductase (nitroreductase family)
MGVRGRSGHFAPSRRIRRQTLSPGRCRCYRGLRIGPGQRIVKGPMDIPGIEYRRPVSLRRESPARGRRLRIDEALLERLLMSPAGYLFLLHLAPRIDKVLIPRTTGRLSSAGIGKVGLVTTTGAKSGRSRTHPLALIGHVDGLLAIGSNYGRARHPAWSTNLLAHPECTVEFMGAPTQYIAELLTGDARASAWATAADFYAGYAQYQVSCAPREIRVFRLRRIAS